MVVKKRRKEVVTLSVKRREKINENAQAEGRYSPFQVRVLKPSQAVFQMQRSIDKVKRHEAAEDAQKHVKRNIPHAEGRHRSGKLRPASQNKIANQGGRYGTQEQRQHAAHGKVEKQDFQRKEHAGEGGVEDARQSTGRAAAQKQRHPAVGHAAISAQITADGSAGVHNGSLRTHGTAKTNGKGACHQRAPAIVALDAGFVLGNGLQHLGNAVADVVLYYIFNDEKAQEHTHAGEQKIGPAAVLVPAGQKVLNTVDGYFQKHRSQPAQHPRYHA